MPSYEAQIPLQFMKNQRKRCSEQSNGSNEGGEQCCERCCLEEPKPDAITLKGGPQHMREIRPVIERGEEQPPSYQRRRLRPKQQAARQASQPSHDKTPARQAQHKNTHQKRKG